MSVGNIAFTRRRKAAIGVTVCAVAAQWVALWTNLACYLSLALCLISIALSCRQARPLGIIMFGISVIYWLCLPLGIPGAQFIVLLPVAAALLIFERISIIKESPRAITLAGTFFAVWLGLCWALGPRSEWATLKLFATLTRMALGYFAVILAIRAGRFAILDVALIGLTTVAFEFTVNTTIISSSIFYPGVWRSTYDTLTDVLFSSRLAGLTLIITFVASSWIFSRTRTIVCCFLLALAGTAPTLLAAGTRQSLVAISVALLAWCFSRRYRQMGFIAVASGIGLILLLWCFGHTSDASRFSTNITGLDDLLTNMNRIDHLSAGLDMYRESPLCGAGLGGYDFVTNVNGRGYPHNLFVELLAETGMVGLLLSLSFLGVSLAVLFASQKHIEAGVLALLLSLWVYCFVIAMFSLDLPGNIEVFYLLAGFGAVFRRHR